MRRAVVGARRLAVMQSSLVRRVPPPCCRLFQHAVFQCALLQPLCYSARVQCGCNRRCCGAVGARGVVATWHRWLFEWLFEWLRVLLVSSRVQDGDPEWHIWINVEIFQIRI